MSPRSVLRCRAVLALNSECADVCMMSDLKLQQLLLGVKSPLPAVERHIKRVHT